MTTPAAAAETARSAPPEVGRSQPTLAPSAERTEALAEHKRITVLACHLDDSDTLAGQLGTESMHLLLSRLLEIARQEVERYGGVISQSLESGFQALFGAPIAHEDHAAHGVLSAIGLRRRLGEISDGLEIPHTIELALGMGLDTGDVIIGGSGDTPVGRPPTNAKILESVSAGGEILVTDAIERLIRGQVQCASMETPEAAGVAGLQAFRVVEAQDGTGRRTEFDSAQLSPFVGRDRELAVLLELLDQADEGRGQVIGVVGEAGAGKSRLLYELRKTISRPVIYLYGASLSYGQEIPYHPLLAMIRSASKIRDDDSAETVSRKLRSSLELVGSDADKSLPYFLRLLGAEGVPDDVAGLEAQAFQKRAFAAMRRMVLNATNDSLVVLEFEDLHWIDETSEAFLESLVELAGAARLFMVFTYRLGYRPGWMDKSFATQITARPLSTSESRAVVEAIVDDEDMSQALSGVVEQAEGNPFFLEELARNLAGRSAADVGVPDTIQGLIMARIDRLPEGHKQTLQIASVLGRQFSRPLLEAIGGVAGDDLSDVLADLAQREFVYESTTDEGTFLFKHALMQEVAYQSLLKRRRQALHLAAAKAIERLYAERLEEVYDLLVIHYPRAADAEKTVHVKAWLAKHPRFHIHFTPTSASWLNMVERLFRDLTTKRLRRGVFRSVPDLIAAIEEHLEQHNENPSPYVWTKSANDILAKVQRARQTLDKTASV